MTPNLDKIVEHYNHAREKHPYFADKLLNPVTIKEADYTLNRIRKYIDNDSKHSELDAQTVLSCEFVEMVLEVAKNNTPAAIEEAYDCIAVLLRIIDVLEGRQELGKPEEKNND